MTTSTTRAFPRSPCTTLAAWLLCISTTAAATEAPRSLPWTTPSWQDAARLAEANPDPPAGSKQPRPPAASDGTQRESRDALFDDDQKGGDSAPATSAFAAAPRFSGFLESVLAYTYASPAHWSRMLVRAAVDGQGSLGDSVKYKVGVRFDYDFVYDLTNFYPPEVAHDARFNTPWRENYLDIGAGDWDFRLGAQQIVWGEMVALFFADVVSARDLREFILPEFDIIRIPQWAARAEYTKGDFHAELVWIPVASYDEIGKPGAEFYPNALPPPPGFATRYLNEDFPSKSLDHTNYGVRLSVLRNGWDLAGFYYGSMDSAPSYHRTIELSPEPAYVYQARHDRINQFGATLAKDLGEMVFKAEAVYTNGRLYSVTNVDDEDGLVSQNTLDLVAGIDVPLPHDTRLNVQLFQRAFLNHDPDIIYDRHETGASVLLNHQFSDRLQAEILWIGSLNRADWLLRPSVTWAFERNWRVHFGVDIFDGAPLGLFGQFSNRDRGYVDVQYNF